MNFDSADGVTVRISEVKRLLELGHSVQVYSGDGFVPIINYVEKGEHPEYILMTESGYTVRCSPDHLFETTSGWESAKNIAATLDLAEFVTHDGIESGAIHKTGKMIPIVDITVDHKNHRYYTNGVSSHNSGGGKSIFMTNTAAHVLSTGKNVLYISMEMSEIRISERIDANLMNVRVDDIKGMTKDSFMTKIDKISAKTQGKLFVKEYPTGAAHSGHFRGLLEELKTKQNFVPDLLVIDYLGICASARIKMGGSTNTNTYVKTIAEELRALAIEYDIPVLTGHQLNRNGFCLDLYTEVNTLSGKKYIKDVEIGDLLESNDGWNTVKTVFPIQNKDRYRVTTASGKTIICSAEHIFPTGEHMLEKSIRSGLEIGDELYIKG
jgi:hypothetical protein